MATIDEYLASVPAAKHAVLQALRAQIRRAAPDATEAMSYGRPAFRLDGQYFVDRVTEEGCSFVTGRAPVVAHADALADYRVWQGTINFAVDRPLPPALVRQLLETRLDESGGGPEGRPGRRPGIRTQRWPTHRRAAWRIEGRARSGPAGRGLRTRPGS
jgi:uncharacterized protein YdhG (YjbR/CyaY superfamily)